MRGGGGIFLFVLASLGPRVLSHRSREVSDGPARGTYLREEGIFLSRGVPIGPRGAAILLYGVKIQPRGGAILTRGATIAPRGHSNEPRDRTILSHGLAILLHDEKIVPLDAAILTRDATIELHDATILSSIDAICVFQVSEIELLAGISSQAVGKSG